MNNTSAYSTLRYTLLSSAVEDINENSTQRAVDATASASVMVNLSPDGKRTVTLLNCITENAAININKSIDLILNGKTLTLGTADAALNFGDDTLCTIDATEAGSSICKECSGTTGNLVLMNGDKLTVLGGSYQATGAFSGSLNGFRVNAGKLELCDCTLQVENTGDASCLARALFVPGADTAVTVSDSTVHAEAPCMAYAILTAGRMETHRAKIEAVSKIGQPSEMTSVTVTVGETGDLRMFDSRITSTGENVYITAIHNSGNLHLDGCGITVTGDQKTVTGITNATVMGENGEPEKACRASIANTAVTVNGKEQHIYGISSGALSDVTLQEVTVTAVNINGHCYGIRNEGTFTAEKVEVCASGVNNPVYGIFNLGSLCAQASAFRASCTNHLVYGIHNTDTVCIDRSTVTASGANELVYGIYNTGTVTAEETTVTVTKSAPEAGDTAEPDAGVGKSAYGIRHGYQTDPEGAVISGTGIAQLSRLTVTVSNSDGASFGIYSGGELHLADSQVDVESQNSDTYGIRNEGSTDIRRTRVHANTNGARSNSYGISNVGTLEISHSQVMADAPGDSAQEDACSTGIMNHGITFCLHTNVFGTLSGFQNNGCVFAQGGVFTGYSHGGFYFAHGPGGIAYVNDAVLRCGYYIGVHTAVFPGENVAPLGGSYVGGASSRNSNMTVYLDSCTFDNENLNQHGYALTLRATSGETGNTVNMSNCRLMRPTMPIRIDRAPADPPHHVNVGIGTGITAERFDHPDLVTFNGENYRRSSALFEAQVQGWTPEDDRSSEASQEDQSGTENQD